MSHKFNLTKGEGMFRLACGGCSCCVSSEGFPDDVHEFTDNDAKYAMYPFLTRERLLEVGKWLEEQQRLFEELQVKFYTVDKETRDRWERLHHGD